MCLINVYPHCEQFVKYECFVSALIDGFWLSPDSEKMTYWSGAAHEEHMCACAQTSGQCNCGMNDNVWREDSGVLASKTHLPVKQLMFGDTDIDQDGVDEKGHYTLGKFKSLKVFRNRALRHLNLTSS